MYAAITMFMYICWIEYKQLAGRNIVVYLNEWQPTIKLDQKSFLLAFNIKVKTLLFFFFQQQIFLFSYHTEYMPRNGVFDLTFNTLH